jgi:probable biosynthetic protein (TIGR04098 family)
MPAWQAYDTTVTMPLLAPGAKLSEVEFLKLLAACQWESIARLFQAPTRAIQNEAGQRLYASVLHVELSFGASHPPDRFGEGSPLSVRNLLRTYAQRFVEGLFVFDDTDVPEAALGSIVTREDLRAQERPWCYMVNSFVARDRSNVQLTASRPASPADEAAALAEPPRGIDDHAAVQRSGAIAPFEDEPGAGIELTPRGAPVVSYRTVPESDINGAGLLYFARYVAITSYAERLVLGRLAPPLSDPLIESLSTERRRIYFFANAAPKDRVDVSVQCRMLPVAAAPSGRRPATALRTPFKLLFRMDLHRRSDHVLMASSLVRKALQVPAASKAVLLEAERFLARLQNRK